MAPGDTYKWDYTDPDEMLQKDKQFYMDWYTDDYSTTNWTPFDTETGAAYLRPSPAYLFTRKRYGSKICELKPSDRTLLRSILINNNEKETVWRAVGILTNDSLAWSKMSDSEKHCEVTIRKTQMTSVTIGSSITERPNMMFWKSREGDRQYLEIGPIVDYSKRLYTGYIHYLPPTADSPKAVDTIRLQTYKRVYKLIRTK